MTYSSVIVTPCSSHCISDFLKDYITNATLRMNTHNAPQASGGRYENTSLHLHIKALCTRMQNSTLHLIWRLVIDRVISSAADEKWHYQRHSFGWTNQFCGLFADVRLFPSRQECSKSSFQKDITP